MPEFLGSNDSDGTVLGLNPESKIGFYGVSDTRLPTPQPLVIQGDAIGLEAALALLGLISVVPAGGAQAEAAQAQTKAWQRAWKLDLLKKAAEVAEADADAKDALAATLEAAAKGNPDDTDARAKADKAAAEAKAARAKAEAARKAYADAVKAAAEEDCKDAKAKDAKDAKDDDTSAREKAKDDDDHRPPPRRGL